MDEIQHHPTAKLDFVIFCNEVPPARFESSTEDKIVDLLGVHTGGHTYGKQFVAIDFNVYISVSGLTPNVNSVVSVCVLPENLEDMNRADSLPEGGKSDVLIPASGIFRGAMPIHTANPKPPGVRFIVTVEEPAGYFQSEPQIYPLD